MDEKTPTAAAAIEEISAARKTSAGLLVANQMLREANDSLVEERDHLRSVLEEIKRLTIYRFR